MLKIPNGYRYYVSVSDVAKILEIFGYDPDMTYINYGTYALCDNTVNGIACFQNSHPIAFGKLPGIIIDTKHYLVHIKDDDIVNDFKKTHKDHRIQAVTFQLERFFVENVTYSSLLEETPYQLHKERN